MLARVNPGPYTAVSPEEPSRSEVNFSMFSLKNKQNAGAVGSGYTVVERVGVGSGEWDTLVQGAPGGGHLLQSHAWGEMKRNAGWRPLRLALVRGGGGGGGAGEVAGAGQFLLRPTWPVPGYLMYCPKGPWLEWDDEGAARAFLRGAAEAAARLGAHTLKIEPEVREGRGGQKALLEELGFRKFRWDLNGKATMVVDLSRPEEDLLAGMKGKTRYNVRLSARKGVRVAEDGSPAAEEAFWRMHKETVERQEFWSRPYSYYRAALRAMREAGRAHLFFAEHEGDRLAAVLVYTFGHKCLYMLGATSREKRNLMPASLLQWEVMRWAKGRGLTHYDMWGIPTPEKRNEDHPLYGVYKFKAGFGGEVEDFVGSLDLPIERVRAGLWDKTEPTYYRIYQRLKGDVYY